LKKDLGGKAKKLTSMTDEQWEELDEKAISAIQLCLAPRILPEVLDKITMVDLLPGLEALYMA